MTTVPLAGKVLWAPRATWVLLAPLVHKVLSDRADPLGMQAMMGRRALVLWAVELQMASSF